MKKFENVKNPELYVSIDPSMNSSAIRIYNKTVNKSIYICFTVKSKKKIVVETDHDLVYIIPILPYNGTKKQKEQFESLYRDKFHYRVEIAKVIIDQIFYIVGNNNATFIIEDYSMGSKGNTFSIGEFVGMIKMMIYDRGHTINLISPNEVKKVLTGKGNSNKEDIYNTISSNGIYNKVVTRKKKGFEYDEIVTLETETPNYTKIENILAGFEEQGIIWESGSYLEDIIDCFGVMERFFQK